MRRLLAGLVLLGGTAPPLLAQERCLLELVNVDRQGVQTQSAEANRNYFAGGNVRMRCVGQDVRMWSDSLASYMGQVVQFIGAVRYRDATVEMTADFGTYFRDADRWEARGNVVLTNRASGAVLRGPSLDYLRQVQGVRDQAEIFADLRPTLTVPVTDSLGREEAPYVIVADRMRMRGEHQAFAGGRVAVDREDLQARADSLRLDTGEPGDGTLLGSASIRRVAEDSFHLTGHRIDLALERREVREAVAKGEAALAATDLDLTADTVRVTLVAREVEQVAAWGDSLRPIAESVDGYQVQGDSVVFDTPGRQLRAARAYGRGWMGSLPDSVTGERDWVTGDSVVARFAAAEDPSGAVRTILETLEAHGQAAAYYRLAAAPGPAGSRAVFYTRADFIQVLMKHANAEATVDEVISRGNVDGVHLQPAPAGARLRVPPLPPGGRIP
jgi:lipopolysaccharide export system protein LptA